MKIPQSIQYINTVLTFNNYSAYLVGGCVRDRLMGKEPKDYDMVTNAMPEDIKDMFPGKVKEAGRIFGVSIINIGSENIELATMRKDGSYTDGRRPDHVIFTDNLKQDAARRDFTMNCIYHNIATGTDIDPFHGIEDIKRKMIYTVGRPYDRFSEDKLRILRAVRFAAQLDFSLHAEVFSTISKMKHNIKVLPMERVRDEFMKSITVRGINLLFCTGLLEEIIPELLTLIGCTQPVMHHPEGDVFEHSLIVLKVLDKLTKNPLVKLAGLLHDIGKPVTRTEIGRKIQFIGHDRVGADIAKSICQRLKLSSQETDLIYNLVKDHMMAHDGRKFAKSTLARFLRKDYINELILLQHADALGCCNEEKSLRTFYLQKMESFATIVKSAPIIKGSDLIDLGLKPGPLFKEILTKCRETQDEGKIACRASGLKYLKELVGS